MAGPEPELHGFARMVGSGVRALVWMGGFVRKDFFWFETILSKIPNVRTTITSTLQFMISYCYFLGVVELVLESVMWCPNYWQFGFWFCFVLMYFFLDPKIHVNVTTAQHGLKTLFSKINFIWGSIEKTIMGSSFDMGAYGAAFPTKHMVGLVTWNFITVGSIE